MLRKEEMEMVSKHEFGAGDKMGEADVIHYVITNAKHLCSLV